MPTLQQIARRLGEEVFGSSNYFYVTPTSFTATTVVAANSDLQDSNASPDLYEGWYILRRGAANSSDRLRRVRTNGGYTGSSGTLTHQGPNYSDITFAAGDEVELWSTLNPETDIRLLIARALGRCYYLDRLPLSVTGWGDGDMESSGTASWTASATETLSKSTTAARIAHGQRALRVQNNGVSSGYVYQQYAVRQDQTFRVYAACNADVGRPRITVWDVTNSANITQTTVPSGYTDRHLKLRTDIFNIPSGCQVMEVRMEGIAGTTDDIYWAYCIPLRSGDRRVQAPSSIEEGRWIVGLDELTGGKYPDANVGPWESFDFQPVGWFRPEDYQQDANPVWIKLPVPWSVAWEPFLVINRPWLTYGNEPAATSTGDGTDYPAPMEYIMAHVKAVLWEMMSSGAALGMELAEMGVDEGQLRRAVEEAKAWDAIFRPGVYRAPSTPQYWAGNWSRL